MLNLIKPVKHRVKYYMRGEESGQLHTEEFTCTRSYEEWMKNHADAIDIFSDEKL